MARVRKKRYQALRTVVLGTTVLFVLSTLLGSLAEAIFIFMLTGIVAGTSVVVPVWGVLAIYAGIAAATAVTYTVSRQARLHSPRGKTTAHLRATH